MKPRFLIIFFIILLGIFFIWQGMCLPKDSAFTENKLFSIERGQNLFKIAENLEKEDLIKNKFLFDFYVLITGTQRKLQAGEYLVNPSMNITEIAKKIISGDIVKEEITIIEGWTLKDIGFYFENKGMFQAEELYDERADVEGYFFPDTYQIRRGVTLEEIINKVVNNFNKKLTEELRSEIERQRKTIFEIVTMASLLEKEVKTKEEKEIVSGIFWKRIKERMPLDSCATIAYILRASEKYPEGRILGGGNWTFEEMRKEIAEGKEIDSPYNTYKYLGLPSGPICNPGLESIIATVYPKDSEYWYYLSTPEGETIFSKTLEEHNIAQAKYLK